MKISRLLKQQRFALTLFILLTALQITACGNGDSPADLNANLNPNNTEIKLSWTTPTQREDGSTLATDEIKSYKIHYGTVTGEHTNNITIDSSTADGGLISEHRINHLAAGTYFFVITTIDTHDRESRNSAEAVITI